MQVAGRQTGKISCSRAGVLVHYKVRPIACFMLRCFVCQVINTERLRTCVSLAGRHLC